MSDVLSQFRCKGPEPFKGDGFEVVLKPITFKQYREVMDWYRGAKGTPGYLELMERKLFALAVGCEESAVDDLDPAKVEAVAREVGERAGLYTRPDEKKEDTPSMTTTSSSPSTLPLPAA